MKRDWEMASTLKCHVCVIMDGMDYKNFLKIKLNYIFIYVYWRVLIVQVE